MGFQRASYNWNSADFREYFELICITGNLLYLHAIETHLVQLESLQEQLKCYINLFGMDLRTHPLALQSLF